MVIGIFFWWMLFHIRESHAGSVCSGDYLSYGDSTEGYLKDSGDFIIFFLYLIKVALLILACYAYWTIFWAAGLFGAFFHLDQNNTRKQTEFIIVTILFLLVLWWIY